MSKFRSLTCTLPISPWKLSAGPDADHELASFAFSTEVDVGEGTVGERVVVAGLDVGHVHAGNAGVSRGRLADDGRPAINGRAPPGTIGVG